MDKDKLKQHISNMYSKLYNSKKEILGYKFDRDYHADSIFVYSENDASVYYCSPAWEFNYYEDCEFAYDNTIPISFQVCDGSGYYSENDYKEVDMVLTYDLDTDINNYYSIVESYLTKINKQII